jgi:hypothetical protein
MQNQFNKMSVFECQTISENIKKLKQEEFKDFQVLDACDATLSAHPHRASPKNMPDRLARCGCALRVASQASYSPEYITPTQKFQVLLYKFKDIQGLSCFVRNLFDVSNEGPLP